MTVRTFFQRLIAAAVLAMAAATAPQAQGYDHVVRAQMLPGWQMPNGNIMAGVRLSLDPGWKTYWRAPGDAGIPPEFDFGASRNLAAVNVHWPRPEVQLQNGMRTFGYSKAVVLPITFVPENPTSPVRLRGQIELGVCREICVPVSLNVSARLPATGGESAIRAALARQPEAARQAGVGRVVCSAQPIADGLRLTARVSVSQLGAEEFAVIELADRSVWISEAQVQRERGELVASVDMVPPTAAPFALNRGDIRITLITESRAIDIRGCVGG